MSAPPPILVIAPGGAANTGGICRVVADLAATWPGGGSRPTMRVIDSGGMAPKWRMPFHFAVALARIAFAALAGRASLLHVHVAEGGSVARKAVIVGLGRALRVPVVLHGHGAHFERFVAERGRFGRALIAATFRAADAVVVLGEAARAHLIATLGVAPGRVSVVPNAVARSSAIAVPARGDDRVCRVVFLGVLGTRKGLDVVLEALAHPSLGAHPIALTVVGNGDRAWWEREAGRLGVAGRVRFTGWRDNAAARLIVAGSDLLVLPSRAEALPVAILEAMAEGVPVIATAVGAVADAVIDGVTGLVVPPGDVDALADALASLAGDPARRRRMGDAGRERARTAFAPDAVCAALGRVFEDASAGARGARRPTGPAILDGGVA